MSANEFNRAEIFSIAKEIDYSPQAIVSRTLTNRPEGTVTLFAFAAGQGLSEHTTPFEAQVHILEGEAKVIIADTPYTLKEGEIIIMPANIPHAVEAITGFKMLLTMIKSKLQHQKQG